MHKEYDTKNYFINIYLNTKKSLIYFKIYRFLEATKKTSIHLVCLS